MAAYQHQLLLKHLLRPGVTWTRDEEILYRDQMRHTCPRRSTKNVPTRL